MEARLSDEESDNMDEDVSFVHSEDISLNEDSEDDSLTRLAQAARRRNIYRGDEYDDEIEDGQYEEDEDAVEEDLEDGEEDDEEDSGDPRANFLRAIGAFPPGVRGQSFVDTVQRLVGGGIFEGGANFRQNNSDIDNLINNLNLRDDTYIVLETLNDLSERLLMMNGITAERMIPANKLAGALVSIMEDPTLADELELQLVACRCLYNFLEVNLDFIHDALHNHAVGALCNKLLEISYIDLAEQALQTLEMISREAISHEEIIANNGLKACLQFLDFLTVHAQRKCLNIVASSCTTLSISNFPMVKILINDIANVIRNHQDSQIIECAWLAISRIITSYKHNKDFLEELFLDNVDLLKEATNILYISVNKGQNSDLAKVGLKYGTLLSLLKSLIFLSNISVNLSEVLLKNCDIGKVIVKSIRKYGKDALADPQDVSIEALMATPSELLSQYLNLAGSFLPVTYISRESPFLRDDHTKSLEKTARDNDRVNLFSRIDLWEFVDDIWLLLINSFQATMDYDIRRKVYICLYRILSFGKDSDTGKIRNFKEVSSVLLPIINLGKIAISREFLNAENCEKEDVEMNSSSTEEDAMIDNNRIINPQFTERQGTNAHMLLWGAFAITNLIVKKLIDVALDFEKQGLFGDIQTISKTLNKNFSAFDSTNSEDLLTSQGFFSDKFTDVEFSGSHRSSDSTIFMGILQISGEICDLHKKRQYSSNETAVSRHYTLLSEVVKSLTSDSVGSYGFTEWQAIWQRLLEILTTTYNNLRVSSFELNSSGLFKALIRTFDPSCEKFQRFSVCQGAFISIFYNDEGCLATTFLISRLQEVLVRSESFEVVTTGGIDAPGNLLSRSKDLITSSMVKQVKLKLTAMDESRSNLPQNMHSLVLSVHAIATFTTVGSFLKQRFKFMGNLSGFFGPNPSEIRASDAKVEPTDKQPNFSINGEPIPAGTTIYGAIYRSLQVNGDEIVDPALIWGKTHEVSYTMGSESEKLSEIILHYDFTSEAKDLEVYDEPTIHALRLLKALYDINVYIKQNHSSINGLDEKLFMNWKLTVKLNRQLEEPLVVGSGTLPSWSIHITKSFPFIFPLETRLFFLQSTSFGYSRLIYHWQTRTNQFENENSNSNGNQNLGQIPQLGRPTRHKVRISRSMILQSAIKVLSMYGSTPGILEIEYFDEAGSGLGPTLEFYSIVSKEFAKRRLMLWRNDGTDEESEEHVFNSLGLFPSPISKEQIESKNGKKVLNLFESLGKFIARALLDSRIIDFNFNSTFIQFIQYINQSGGSIENFKQFATIAYLRLVDSKLANSLDYLLQFVDQYRSVPSGNRSDITIDGSTLKDLELYYELPGYPEYELLAGGSDIQIDDKNIESYINSVLDATLCNGVSRQIQSFIDGFSQVFPINSLVIFSPGELVELFGNANEDWSVNTLTSAIHANHGYTKESSAIQSLIDILVSLRDDEKRAFLQFLTGAPKLPVGGFKALRPELTVVRKSADGGLQDDDYLPSVMTCANYLKLPNYSSPEVMRMKLLQAINEGAGAFLLS